MRNATVAGFCGGGVLFWVASSCVGFDMTNIILLLINISEAV